MSVDSFSDASDLPEELQAYARKAHERDARLAKVPPGQRSKLAPEKQESPIGIHPDGTPNIVGHASDLTPEQLRKIKDLLADR
jgi:hypothetical protein